MGRWLRRAVAARPGLTLLIGALVGLASLVVASAPSAVASSGSTRVGPTPKLPAGAHVIRRLPSTQRLHLTVTLRPRNPAALAAYATAVATPGSRLYHHYLTVTQFASRFGASSSAISTVKTTLRAHGLDVGGLTRNHLALQASGSSAQVARAFSTSFNQVRLPSGRVAFANATAPLLPASVASNVQGVLGLDSLVQLHPLGPVTPAHPVHGRPGPHVVTGGPQPTCSGATSLTSTSGPYTADEIAFAYNYSSLYGAGDEGLGQTIALYELQAFKTSDITTYDSCYTPAPSGTLSTVGVDSATPTTTGTGGSEATLDIEDVVGLAPKANVIVYDGPNTTTGAYDTYNAIASADAAKVISTSWGLCESSNGTASAASENALFEEMATQGQTIVAAAGDSGSSDCSSNGHKNTQLAVDDPASQPYVTGVGGTTLAPYTPRAETVWNGTCSSGACGGGGGISSVWTMPSYQSSAAAALNVINTNSSGTPCSASTGQYCREVPDVTANADPNTGYVIYLNGKWTVYGGTSAAAPAWGALFALVNASSGCTGTQVGFANPALYDVGGNAFTGGVYTKDFFDITSGTNALSTGGQTLYPAASGYDMASGLGSPDGSTLPADLCAASSTTAPSLNTLATLSLPAGSGSMPTGVAIDQTNHIAYIAESNGNAVAKITGTSGTSFTSASDASSALPGLNFPDDLALDSAGHLFASDFCVGSQASICSSEPSGTTTAISQQTGPTTGQRDVMGSCSYPSGDAVTSNRLILACAGSSVVVGCSTSTAPGSGGCGPTATTDPTTIATGAVPSGMVAVPTQIYSAHPAVLVADAGNNKIWALADSGTGFSTFATAATLSSTCEPANLAMGPVTRTGNNVYSARVYVACPNNGTFEVGTLANANGTISLAGFAVVSLPTNGASTPSPYGIAVNSTGTVLAVTDSANNDVVIYPSVNDARLGTPGILSVGSVPVGVGIDGGNVFVANEGSGTVSVVDPPSQPAVGQVQRAARRGSRSNGLRVSHTPLIAPLRSPPRR